VAKTVNTHRRSDRLPNGNVVTRTINQLLGYKKHTNSDGNETKIKYSVNVVSTSPKRCFLLHRYLVTLSK
jgi:hypothetical protein